MGYKAPLVICVLKILPWLTARSKEKTNNRRINDVTMGKKRKACDISTCTIGSEQTAVVCSLIHVGGIRRTYRGWVGLGLLKADGTGSSHWEQHTNITAASQWGKTLQACPANAVGYLIPPLDMMASRAQGHWWWTAMSAEIYREKSVHAQTHRLWKLCWTKQEEQEKEEALTVMSYQGTENLSTEQPG